jgi:PKD repeat protein
LGGAFVIMAVSLSAWWWLKQNPSGSYTDEKNALAQAENNPIIQEKSSSITSSENDAISETSDAAEKLDSRVSDGMNNQSSSVSITNTTFNVRKNYLGNNAKTGIEISQNTTALDEQKKDDGKPSLVHHSSTNILSNIRQTCAGTEVSFKPQSGPTDGSYLWNFGDGAFSSEPNPKHRFLKPGTYEVSLSVTDNKNAQINTVNMSETITILPNPIADFDWAFINGSKEAPTVEIKNLSSNAVTTQWSFADGSQSNAEHPIKSFTNKGSHSVMVTAVNEYGCKDQRIKYININSDYNLNAPGFVHCGEGFMPEGLSSAKGKITLTIYDGAKKIFETKSNKSPWFCSDANGNKVEPNKQYPWIAIIHDNKTGEERYYSGAVLVKP